MGKPPRNVFKTKAQWQAIIDAWAGLEKAYRDAGDNQSADWCEEKQEDNQHVMDVIYGDGTDKPMGIMRASELVKPKRG